MLRIYGCVTQDHDLRLVLLAALICLLSSYTSLNIFARARDVETGRRWFWLAMAPAVYGAGVWATHFVAMLAFRPGFPVGYDIGLTAFSIIVAMAISALGFAVALLRRVDAPVGGAIIGAAIGAMHYVGMRALRVPAEIGWDGTLVWTSLAIGIVFGAAALWVAARGPLLRYRLGGAAMMTLAICGLHFTAMTAVSFRLGLPIGISDQVMAPEWVAVAVATVTILIVALGLVSSVFDQHLATRAAQEAERLRRHVAELQETKGVLEATTLHLEDALAAAAAGSQAKSQFLATMSHELRTPLNAIIGFSDMIATQPYGPLGDERYRDYAVTILESGHHLLDLINEVLDFSKIDAGRLELNEEPIDLETAIESAVRMVRGQAGSGIVLSTDIDPALPPLFADPRRVRQILLNLLSNAVKFTPEGGEVRVVAYRRDADLAIAVADTGIGIAPEDIPMAFERFGQIDNRLNRRFEGTGLGLPLSKKLMELQDGTLELESRLGEGTTVTMVFPAHRCCEQKAA